MFLAGIGVWFGLQALHGDRLSPRGVDVSSSTQNHGASQKDVLPPCAGKISWLTRGGQEVRFSYEGQAQTIRMEWTGGAYESSVADACTGTECRVILPRPGLGTFGCGWTRARGWKRLDT
ncbi:hypothetical protein Thermus77420_24350 [Thermus thalpophilus]